MSATDSHPLLRRELQWKAVLIQCLDRSGAELKGHVASGFLVQEEAKIFLYTAWHVVTQLDPHDIKIPSGLPRRRFLRVSLQDCRTIPMGRVIGGLQTVDVPLYEDTFTEVGPLRPLWLQDATHVRNDFLNHAGLHVPFWGDVVKIEMPSTVNVDRMQLLDPGMGIPGTLMPEPGDKCYVVGFPYGFSVAIGADQPTPAVLTRFIASTHIAGTRNREILLDGSCAPAMSGCPVFLERDGGIFLFGSYTGVIFPGHELKVEDKATALGTVVPLAFYLWGHVKLVSHPDTPLAADGNPG